MNKIYKKIILEIKLFSQILAIVIRNGHYSMAQTAVRLNTTLMLPRAVMMQKTFVMKKAQGL